ncbi:MAG: ABC exporter membrane fusion protein [Cyanobacteriota bacterium]|nr:ABC exporter membrane fusion protein [Cyanobacteriota bacterium]
MISAPSFKWPSLGVALVTATSITLLTGYFTLNQSRSPSSSPAPLLPTPPPHITALGRIEPASEVIRVAVPASVDGDRLRELPVKQGDRVTVGQVLGILDSYAQREANWRQAQQDLAVAQAQLAQVKAGAKAGEIAAQQATIRQLEIQQQGEIAAQQATVNRLEAEMANADAEYQRYQSLYQEGAVSQSQLDSKRLSWDTTRAQVEAARVTLRRLETSALPEIQAAQATLNRIAEVRPVDVQVAEAEVDRAQASVVQAQRQLEQAVIRAPQAGQILKIHTQPGEKIQADGLMDLADTQQMMVVAEVYQTDIGRVQVGQPAQIVSSAFGERLQGTVSEIGLQVEKQNVFSDQPGENLDQRVVEVKIRLSPESSQQVASMTNLQVDALIQAQ